MRCASLPRSSSERYHPRVARRVFVALLIAACGAKQTDPPDRPLGAPARGGDSGAADGGTTSGDSGTSSLLDGSGDGTTSNLGDAAGPDTRVDGAECTTSSSFSAPSAPAGGLTLAAYSLVGFSGVQGKCGWSYGYVAPATSSAFLPMGEYDAAGETWYVQDTVFWTFLSRTTTHPNGVTTSGGRTAVDHWSVRRWTANYTGAIRITGSVKKAPGTTGGNGILARILIGGNELYEQNIIDELGMTFDVSANVAVGQSVDFVVDPNASQDGFDSTDVTAAIWK